MSNHVQHVIKIFQALPLLIFYSVKGQGRAWLARLLEWTIGMDNWNVLSDSIM